MNEAQQDQYFIEGSFLQIPKTFTIFDAQRAEVAVITKKMFSFLPKFYVEMDGRELLTIKKEISFFKARYSIDGAGIEVRGNWWDMNFEILHQGETIGRVNKKWLSWGDSYEVLIVNDAYETIVIAIVVAIDCVKDDQQAASSASI